MSQTIRGGREALNKLLADLRDVDEAARDIGKHFTNARLVEDAAQDIRKLVRSMQNFIADELEPMLHRREKNSARELDAIIERLAQLERRMDAADRERSGVRLIKGGERGQTSQ